MSLNLCGKVRLEGGERVENLDRIIKKTVREIGSKNSKTPMEKKRSQMKNFLAISLSSIPKSKEEALRICRENCFSPEKCPFGGEILYQPEDDKYGPYFVECPIYAKWKLQMELNQKIMDIIPRKFWDKSFENFKPYNEELKKVLNVAVKYVADKAYLKGTNLIFLGGYGVGKTHLAAAIVKEVIKDGCNAVFIVTSSLTFASIEEIREKFGRIRDVDLVVLDDISAEAEHKVVLSEIFNLLNYRYEDEKGLVLTSNLSPSEFKEALGERMMDRLIERSIFLNISKTKSFRRRKRSDFLDILKKR